MGITIFKSDESQDSPFQNPSENPESIWCPLNTGFTTMSMFLSFYSAKLSQLKRWIHNDKEKDKILVSDKYVLALLGVVNLAIFDFLMFCLLSSKLVSSKHDFI